MTNPRFATLLAACGFAMILAGCENPFKEKDYLGRKIPQTETHQIDTINLPERSTTQPASVDQDSVKVARGIVNVPPPLEKIELSLADVRAAALQSNLDLAVQLYNPSIAQADVDFERAKFEWAFNAGYQHITTDAPAALGTEGSQGKSDFFNLGVNIPLRTGGTVNVNLPFSETSTNNPFSLLNPAYTADLAFSISQPILRNAGVNVNTNSIRIAEYSAQATDARTKLEAIRILANADRAYWRLYAARRELEVRQKQFELARAQLESARRKVAAGDAAQIEVTRAESGVASGLRNIINARAAQSRFQRDLKRIMQRSDLPLSGPTEIITTTEPQPLGLKLEAEALANYAVANRMEMLELELQLAIDASTIDFRRNQKLPLFTMDYTYRINGLGSSYSDAFDQMSENRFADWIIGLNVQVPIGNEQAKTLYHRAVLERLQRLATKALRDAAIRQEVYDALDTLEENWQRILAARQSSILAGRTFEGEKRQFDVGLRTSTDVQDALTSLADAQSQEVLALANYQISQVDIAFATGTLLGSDSVTWTATDPKTK